MASFADYIQKQAAVSTELPTVHTTEYLRLASIQASNKLQTCACNIFKEPLIYLFYGRPAYRDISQITPTRDIGFYPICFIFRPGTVIQKAKRLYPFDTGASQRGLYEPAVMRKQALADYPVSAIADNAKRIVGSFFETEEGYLSGQPRAGLLFSAAEADAQSYYDLINGGGNPDCDDRCSAVEVQVAECLEIPSSIMAVVLPTCFLEDASLVDTILNVWGALPLTYSADVGMRPLEFHGAIRHLVREFYRRSGLI